MKAKSADFFVILAAALEEAEILCTVVSDTSTDMIIPPQALLPQNCPGT
jgi:hypothetical protein